MESIATTMDDGTGEDRISQLPDPILHQILSHLRTNHALPTFILSKRWRDLWVSMPYFFFDDYEEYRSSGEADPNFIGRVNSVLRFRDASDIHTFKLVWVCCFSWRDQYSVHIWAKHAMIRNVKVLKINTTIKDGGNYGGHWELPDFFPCNSAVEITLKISPLIGCFNPTAPPSLGRLRKLHLAHVDLKFVINRLMNGCPVLEDLKMQECWFRDLDISSNSLKRLRVKCCSFYGTKIKISAPSLHCFCCKGNNFLDDDETPEVFDETPEVLIGNLSSVVHASIQLYDMENSTTLRFTSLESKCISGDSGPSTFCNLKELNLDCLNIEDDFEAVTFFLQHSPNLEKLVLDKENLPYEIWTKFYDCPHLKMEIVYQFGEENERVIELVEDFLLSECDCPMETQQ